MNKKGFTLIELMIVVAIIGILAAIAIPNFLKFQCKGRQSEARTNLGGIFTSEQSFYSTYNEFTPSLTAINWVPTGCPRYVYGFVGTTWNPAGAANQEAEAYIIQIGATINGNVNNTAPGGSPLVDANNNPLYSNCWGATVEGDLGNADGSALPTYGNTTPDVYTVNSPGDRFIAAAVSRQMDSDISNDAQVMNNYREVGFGVAQGWGNDCAD